MPPGKGALLDCPKNCPQGTFCQCENITTQQVEEQTHLGIFVCCGGWGKEGMGW